MMDIGAGMEAGCYPAGEWIGHGDGVLKILMASLWPLRESVESLMARLGFC